jgi:hypothetical protein
VPAAAGAGAGAGAGGQQDWLNLSETVLNICGHVAGLISAALNLHNNRSNKVNKKPAAAASTAKYIKVQSV